MKSYSAVAVFSEREQAIRLAAERIVETFPDQREPWLRCHEIARAVAHLLQSAWTPPGVIDVQDGKYGLVDHSWCRIRHNAHPDASPFIHTYSVLDTYAVGRLPQVQLVSFVVGLREFKIGARRTDIDEKTVARLIAYAEGCAESWRPEMHRRLNELVQRRTEPEHPFLSDRREEP